MTIRQPPHVQQQQPATRSSFLVEVPSGAPSNVVVSTTAMASSEEDIMKRPEYSGIPSLVSTTSNTSNTSTISTSASLTAALDQPQQQQAQPQQKLPRPHDQPRLVSSRSRTSVKKTGGSIGSNSHSSKINRHSIPAFSSHTQRGQHDGIVDLESCLAASTSTTGSAHNSRSKTNRTNPHRSYTTINSEHSSRRSSEQRKRRSAPYPGTRGESMRQPSRRTSPLPTADSIEDPIPIRPSINVMDHENDKGLPYSTRESLFVIAAGVLLAFNTGYVNGSCLTGLVAPSGRAMPTAGFTVPYTASALGLAEGDVEVFTYQSFMIMSFVFGSCISGLLTPDATPYRIEPMYGPTFLIGGCFLTLSSIFAAMGIFENFIFYFAAAASGIQNGISSTYSANLIRSTGLTGTSTDIGLFVGQLLRGHKKNSYRLMVLICLTLAFWFGGFVAFYATQVFRHWSLLFNAGLFLAIGFGLVLFLVAELGISFRSAVFGTWNWSHAINQLALTFGEGESDEAGGQTKAMTEDEMFAIFDKVDTDKSGFIDEEELFVALSQTGLKLTRKEASGMMRQADLDGDGVLSREEWRNIAMSSQSENGRKK